MSLKESLQREREKTQAEKDAEIAQKAETQKEQEEREEAERVEVLRTQIAGLKNKKAELEAALGALKGGYKEAGTALAGFKDKDKDVAGVYKEYETDLAEKGISSKADLIQSPDYAGEEEVVSYKEAGAIFEKKLELFVLPNK